MSENQPAVDTAATRKLGEAREKIMSQLSQVIVGQQHVIEELLISMFSRGHCLLEGVPGLAKTLLVRSLASSLQLDFGRIQFTPDLMPADITGTDVLDTEGTERGPTHERRHLRFLRGPIFNNVVLADEINRASPKTQSALLEAMQEAQVTIGGIHHPLPRPFFVLHFGRSRFHGRNESPVPVVLRPLRPCLQPLNKVPGLKIRQVP